MNITPAQTKLILLAQLALTIAVPFWVASRQRPPAVAVVLHIALPRIPFAFVALFPR